MIVAGSIVFALGLAPVYGLSTDLIVSTAHPSQAGTAGAVGETGAELGGALGIALLGSLGVAVYRAGGGTGPTFGEALARGDGLGRARVAFEQAYTTIAGAAALILLAALATVVLLSRSRAEDRRRRSAAIAS